MRRKCRIIERTDLFGITRFIIQRRHIFFRYWIDARINSMTGEYIENSYSTYELAKENIKFFNGTKPKEEIKYIEY